MNDTKKKPKQKKKSKLIDFQKEKSARDFQKAIETGELYRELRPKDEKKN
jgi:hypothetical protein